MVPEARLLQQGSNETLNDRHNDRDDRTIAAVEQLSLEREGHAGDPGGLQSLLLGCWCQHAPGDDTGADTLGNELELESHV